MWIARATPQYGKEKTKKKEGMEGWTAPSLSHAPSLAGSRGTEFSVPQSGGVEPTPTHRVLHEPLQLELLLLGRILGDDERLRLFLGPGRSHRSGSGTRHSRFPTSSPTPPAAARLDDDKERASRARALPEQGALRRRMRTLSTEVRGRTASLSSLLEYS